MYHIIQYTYIIQTMYYIMHIIFLYVYAIQMFKFMAIFISYSSFFSKLTFAYVDAMSVHGSLCISGEIWKLENAGE